VNGRKRHLLVDTLGLMIAIVVHAANIQDRDGAKILLHLIRDTYLRIRLIWADGGYAGKLIEWVSSLRSSNHLRLEIVKRSDGIKGFYVLPRRWVVERTFGWLGRHRRLSKDYEYLPETSENMIRIAMIKLMVRRLATA
jgi:putative transposase